MYGKIFASAFTGSMLGSGPDVFAVWAYIIAHAVAGQIELNSTLVGVSIGMPPERVEAAIDFLSQPDPRSRSKTHAGRRIIKEGAFAYRVVNHALYRRMRDEDERRAYNAGKQREYRAQDKRVSSVSSSTKVNHGQPQCAHTEAEAEAEAERSIPKGSISVAALPRDRTFKKPNLEEVKLAIQKAGLPESEAERFLNHYEANGWRVGRNPMRSWPHAVGTWAANYRAGTFKGKEPLKQELTLIEKELAVMERQAARERARA